MITSVSLNPSIDRTVAVERFTVGGLNRVAAQTDVAAGKGVNVALAAAALGADSECIGFMYREGAALYRQRLDQGGVQSDFVWCDGAVRVNVKVFDRAKGEITEINSSGMPVTPDQLQAMVELVRDHARDAEFMILSGSMPPACPVDFYRTLAEAAASAGCRVLLDADGDRLKAGLQARPYLIKPNRYELELLSGKRLETREELLAAARDCIALGAQVVAVSMGGDGALITDGSRAYVTDGLRVEVQSTVAAGDSMIAGLAVGFSRGMDLAEAFRLGVAAATARCMTPPDEIITAETCEMLANRLRVERMA